MTRDSFVDEGKWLLPKCDCLRPCNFPIVGSRVIADRTIKEVCVYERKKNGEGKVVGTQSFLGCS